MHRRGAVEQFLSGNCSPTPAGAQRQQAQRNYNRNGCQFAHEMQKHDKGQQTALLELKKLGAGCRPHDEGTDMQS